MTPSNLDASQIHALPPLILHPFSDTQSPQKLVQSSRASLILQGLLPAKEESIERLHEILLDGRYCEIRMLFYVGKDTVRWIEQCVEFVESEPALRSLGIEWQTFAALIVEDTPSPVLAKLRGWGVTDHRAIFSRGLGLNSIFCDAPPREMLSDHFVRNYHQYADQMYASRMSGSSFARIRSTQFSFELFASGEYTSMLEQQWQKQEPQA